MKSMKQLDDYCLICSKDITGLNDISYIFCPECDEDLRKIAIEEVENELRDAAKEKRPLSMRCYINRANDRFSDHINTKRQTH